MDQTAHNSTATTPATVPRMLRTGGKLRLALALGISLAVASMVTLAAPTRAGVVPVTDQRLGVLASFYPSERDFPGSNHPMWDRLASVGSDAGLVATVELTTSSIDYVDFVAREKRVVQTMLATLNANVDHLMVDSAVFQKQTYGFNGVLLRGYSGACDGTQPTTSLVSQLRGLGFAPIAISTYGQPESCFGPLADVLLNYEGSLAGYGAVSVPTWLNGPTPKLWHVVYSVDQSQIASTIAASRMRGADYVMTSPSSGPVEAATIPADPYWSSLRSVIRNGAPAPIVDENWPRVLHQRTVLPAFGTVYPNWPLVHSLPLNPLDVVIVNASNGPGSFADPALVSEVQTMRAAGRTVLGYITAGYLPSSARTIQQVVDEAVLFRAFYGVDGFFVDEVRPECTTAASYAALATQMRAAAPGPIVLNPGRNVGECLAATFDAIVNFEGPMSSYRTWQASTWTGAHPSNKFWHLVHTATTAEITEAVQLSGRRQAGRVYVTTLPGPIQWTSPLSTIDLAALTAALAASGRVAAPVVVTPVSPAPRRVAPVVTPPVSPPVRRPAAAAVSIRA